MKDLPTELPPGITIAAGAAARRRCAMPSSAPGVSSLAALPPGAVVGSSSLRRQAQVKRLRPDLQAIDFRGNVETRLKNSIKAWWICHPAAPLPGSSGSVSPAHVTSVLPTDEMLPAVAQRRHRRLPGRSDDAETRDLLQALNDDHTATAVALRARAFLGELDGSCRTPIAGLAEIADGVLRFRGRASVPKEPEWHEIEKSGAPEDAVSIGASSGREAARACRSRISSPPSRLADVMRVLVTRPEPDATRQAKRLAARRSRASARPVARHRGRQLTCRSKLDGAQALIVTSRNALRALASHRDLAAVVGFRSSLSAKPPRKPRCGRPASPQVTSRSRNGRRVVAPDRRHAQAKCRGRSCHLAGETVAFRLEIGAASRRLRAEATCPLSGWLRRRGCRERAVPLLNASKLDGVILMSPRTASPFSAALVVRHGALTQSFAT